MNESQKPEFADFMTQVLAFFKQDVSDFTLDVWWFACQQYTMEQVKKALSQHATDPDQGRFAPKPADITRILGGTKTDQSMIAWSKAYGAIGPVGAYRSVVFDDPAIHATIESMGGWVKFCRMDQKELSFLQTQFCKQYQAYVNAKTYPFPPRLCGEGDGDDQYTRFGLKPPKPMQIGDPKKCDQVMQLGHAERIHSIGQVVKSIGLDAEAA